MKNLWLPAFLLWIVIAALGRADAATTTTPITVTSTVFLDLGAGPILLSAQGSDAIYVVADTQPAATATGHLVKNGAPALPISTTAHIWARSAGSFPAQMIVSVGTGISVGSSGGSAYALASNVGAAGATAPISAVNGASYIFACTATTWNSATAQLQALGPDGVKYLPVGTALTADSTQGVVIGANATVRINVTGTPTGLYCNLS